MNTVVTGATGHLGNVLVRELLSRGESVQAIIPPFEDTTSLEGLEVEKVEGDVLNVDSLIPAFKKADVVYHLAGIIFPSPRRMEVQYQVNVIGTRNVLEASLRSGVGRLVHVSSIEAIVTPPHGTVFDETGPFDPARVVGGYGKTKSQASLEVLSAVERGLDAVIVCPTGAIGPYDFKPSKTGQYLTDAAKKKLKGRLYVKGGAYDFVDVRDIAIGQILACEKGRTGEAYILSGERISMADLASLVQEAAELYMRCFGMPQRLYWVMANIAHIYYTIKDIPPTLTLDGLRILTSNSFISHEKAHRELSYSPRPLRETIADTIKWFRESGRL